jgi:hypothetical protein
MKKQAPRVVFNSLMFIVFFTVLLLLWVSTIVDWFITHGIVRASKVPVLLVPAQRAT